MLVFKRETCEESKNVLRKIEGAAAVWRNRLAPSKVIGNCTNLIRLLQPTSCEDFWTKYITYAAQNQDKPIKDRGLTEEELLGVAQKYKNMTECNSKLDIDIETYLWDAVCHIIVETWDGQQKEREFKEYLNSLGYTCSNFEGSIDGKYGVDIVIRNPDGKKSFIQIKPKSFFASRRWDVRQDRINLCHKYENTLRKLGVKTCYAIYTKDKESGKTLWAKNGNGFRYKIDELFEYQADNINETFMEKSVAFNFCQLT